MTDAAEGPLIYLVAGEPSGDLLAARLMRALKRETGGRVRFRGVGGPQMEAEGFKSLFDIREIAIMGLVEVVAHIPTVLRRMRECHEDALAAKPDLFLSIDSPSFSLEVSKKLTGQGYPLVHYVAPTVWAWKAGRAKRIARFLNHLLCLLPFEPPYFEVHGLPATFIGHPAVEAAERPTDPLAFRAAHRLGDADPLLCVLPGSRRGEVKRHAPIFGQALGLLAEGYPGVQALVPTVPTVSDHVKKAVAGWPVPAQVLLGDEEKYQAFAASRAALAASGTVGIELAVAGLPAVMAYKVNWLSAAMVPLFVKLRYASIASLVLDRLVQPECLQHRCNPKTLARILQTLIDDSGERARVIADGREAALALGQGGEAPSLRAARVLLGLLQKGKP
ncbi:MAG: lipid-A-disaccharide synthase [Pseudomonadota bacterium]